MALTNTERSKISIQKRKERIENSRIANPKIYKKTVTVVISSTYYIPEVLYGILERIVKDSSESDLVNIKIK